MAQRIPGSSLLSSRSIPPLLEPYLALPPDAGSLALLTSVLGASTNWLVLRYLTAYLLRHQQQQPQQADDEAGEEQQDVRVVLVSFMRDYAFWRDGAGRLGLDLEAQSRKGRFRFIDGLTGLFLDGAGASKGSASRSSTSAAVLSTSAGLQGIGRTIHSVVDELLASSGAGGQQPKVVLIIDQPDLLLAATGDESPPPPPPPQRQGSAVTGGGLQDLLLDLREKVYSCLVTASADEPLVSSQSTTLEKEHAAFVLSLAHQAETVLSLRLLDTGTANDVSGVVRITHGTDDAGEKIPDVEYLYHVGSDGGVRVFGRGQ